MPYPHADQLVVVWTQVKGERIGWPVHGYGISLRIRTTSQEVLNVQQGSLYPALHRLEGRDWLLAEWGASENGRQAKFYRLSAKGKKQLLAEEAN